MTNLLMKILFAVGKVWLSSMANERNASYFQFTLSRFSYRWHKIKTFKGISISKKYIAIEDYDFNDITRYKKWKKNQTHLFIFILFYYT